MRILVYTGKGGVGKTSVAAATAGRLVAVADHLWGQEVDSLREAERSWGAVQGWLAGVLRWANVADVNSEELIVFPGLEELFSLLQILRHAGEGLFEVLVVDCAPTGETLRLLSDPNVIRWWLNRIFPIQRRMARLARPVVRVVTGG